MKIFSVIFLSCLCAAGFWLFDIRGGELLWKQHRALSFATTEGTIQSSQVTTSYGSKGRIHYHVHISYIYRVDGQGYSCGRYRYDGHPDDSRLADAIVAAHPVGSTVPVYYDPQNPADALISAGEDGQDVYMLFITTPLCLLFLYLVIKTARESFPGSTSPAAGGVKVISEALITRVRLPRFRPEFGAVVAMIALSLVGGILMFAGAVPGAPLAAGGFLLVIVLLGGVAAYGWQYRNLEAGRQDLLIDFGARTVRLPLTYKRRTPITVPFSEIREVALQRVRHQNRRSVYYTYMVTLEMKDGILQRLIDLNEARAESLAGWLNHQFGFNANAPQLDTEI